jgi:hypothetical protein
MAKRRYLARSTPYAMAIALLVAPVAAQAASSTDSATPDPSAGHVAPDSAFAKQPGDLSDKLDKSNGVIRPKEVDPSIEKTPPPTGTAAVIRPPGSDGGVQSVQPK